MTETTVRRALAAILTSTALVALAAPGAAAQRVPPAPAARQPQAPQPTPPATAPAFQEEQRAEQTRDQLNRLFEKYPPQVGRVFKLEDAGQAVELMFSRGSTGKVIIEP